MDISRLGERIGDYPAGGIGALLGQFLRRFAIGLFVLGVVVSLADGDDPAFSTVLPRAILVLAPLFGLHFAWRAVTARLGVNRYRLHENGVYATNLFAQQRDVITWDEVAGVREMSGQSILYNFYRLELHRHGSAPMAIITAGFKRTTVEAVLQRLQKAGERR
ncbi:hypothetical protein AMIS_26420 [Actinoplanes missouriensis 431]|uniref:Uncharacterized protein n=1 Tax=Actinoplanes missouriensis (strain ATCC 14538 / DSM 43046 / CBS 188.64 / JCM 3121 / NBRC 102363 / NCIMB 12654 / NRRL B-3342 / UNCC 431) TaxID=512565 RepID=I0H4C5_ACTM4|nr:hypothetical protein [Actinoplanes missouriensis]BAL87862.1 hypothetical protein AMIS_26420 [Actinoplanes missouriensis 431]